MIKIALPEDEAVSIKYFTSRIHHTENDPEAPKRQNIYLRALRGEGTQVIEGKFQKNRQWMPRADDPSRSCYILKVEEKMTDTLIVAEMIMDGVLNLADAYVLVSNDSDMKPALDKLHLLNKTVGVLYPNLHANALVNHDLKTSSNFQKPIKQEMCRQAQFPQKVPAESGKFVHRPRLWKQALLPPPP